MIECLMEWLRANEAESYAMDVAGCKAFVDDDDVEEEEKLEAKIRNLSTTRNTLARHMRSPETENENGRRFLWVHLPSQRPGRMDSSLRATCLD